MVGIPATIVYTTAEADTAGSWSQADDGRWYFKDPSGQNEKGWIVSNHNWYLLGDDGVMKVGWQLVDGKWYYFHTVADGTMGRMYINTVTPDGFRVGLDGVWDGQGQ